MQNNHFERKHGFGTAPVFFTAISTILGAILFLRFGYAVGTLGFYGVNRKKKCSDFGKMKCSKFGNKSTVFSGTTLQ